ncbi:MAG TPA: DUF748 domain-containing protein [Opitutaceae bacterium]|nr:DUF748 domain-containing protein [Opitutaceae bacterium]
MPNRFSIHELRRQSGARVRRARRWRLSLIIGIAVFVVLGLAAVVFIAPPFVKRQMERRLGAALHREVTIRNLQLNPFVLSTTIDGVAINDPDGRLLFGCERLYVHFDAWSLFSRQWIFKEVSLTAPAARLEIKQDGTLNISDLLALPAEKSAAPGKSRPIRLRQFTVARAHFTFADHSHAQDFSTELGPLNFSLKDFSTAPVAPGAPYEFTASTESGESLHWRGTLSADPLRSAGEFALGQIVLKKYAPYYAGPVRGEVLAGTIDVAGRYEIDFSATPRVMKLAGGELHLRGLQLALPGAATPVIDLPAADLTGLDASLAPLKISVAKLELAGGNMAVQRAADGTLNLSEIFAVPAGSSPSSAAPDVSLAALEVHGLALTLDDATTPHPAHNAITSLDLSAREISLAPNAPPVPLELALRFSSQGVLALKGSVALAPYRADLAGDLTDFPLANVAPYLESLLNLRIAEGAVSAHGQITVAVPADAAPQIGFHGDAEMGRCVTADGSHGEDFVSFASLGFTQLNFTSAPLAIVIGQVSLIEPSLHFTLYPDGSTNLDTVLRRAAPASSSETVSLPVVSSGQPAVHPPAGTSKITIGRVVLANGSLTFTDRSIEPNTSVAVGQLAGAISGLSSDESARATVDLRAEVDNSAPITIAGEINPLSSDAFTDLTVSCADIDLQPASPYLGKYAGYNLGRGNLSFDTKVHLDQRRLDSENVATLNQFTLGEKTNSPDATSLPVRFAVALLKDASGKIVIDLPVQGSLDDPNFRIGRVVLRVITNLLTKAATAPFSLLGSMFGGTNQPLDRIDFAPGSNVLTPRETQKLDILVRALAARPGLNLEVAGAADPDADTPPLQTQKLKQILRERIWESRRAGDPSLPPVEQIQVTPDELNRALAIYYFKVFQPGPMSATGKNTAAPAKEGPPVFPRNPNYFYGPTARFTPPARTEPPVAVSQPAGPPQAVATPIVTLREMVVRLTAQINIDDNDLRQLAADRAQHVKDYLLAQGVSDGRVLSAESAPDSAPRVTLRLK